MSEQFLSEDVTLQIFEIMLKSRIEQQLLMEQEPEGSEDVLSKVVLRNVKTMDRIFFEFGVEFK